MERYLLNCLKDSSENELYSKYIEYFKVDLDDLLYGYGDNLNENYPMVRNIGFDFYLDFIKKVVRFYKSLSTKNRDCNILSFLAFPDEIAKKYNLNFLGSIILPIGTNIINSSIQRKFYLFYNKLVRTKPFNEILHSDYLEKLEEIKLQMLKEYKKLNIEALFLGSDENFVYKYHIDMFKELYKPSFNFLHGIPGCYNMDIDNRADYLCVWGDKIKQHYVDAGFKSEKILVVGNRKYIDYEKNIKLRNNLSNILVATTASIHWAPIGWNYEEFGLYDRNLLLVYSYSVMKVLKIMGVNHARLRVHPSVNKEWVSKYIDPNFYTVDYMPLVKSLKESTLVIGPTSTVWLESLLNGVNYLIYEPSDDGVKNMNRQQLAPPFDGSNDKLVVAFNEEELLEMLKNRYVTDMHILEEYIQPFNFSPVDNILKQL